LLTQGSKGGTVGVKEGKMGPSEVIGLMVLCVIVIFFLIQIVIIRWIFRINERTLYLKQIRDNLNSIHLLIAKEKK